MPLAPPDVYHQELSSLVLGHALWEPDPGGRYDCVSIGDVGYVDQGYFVCMFNVLPTPQQDPGNSSSPNLREPAPNMMESEPFQNTRTTNFDNGSYCSRHVAAVERDGHAGKAASIPISELPSHTLGGNTIVSYTCRKNVGAFLNIPHDGRREDVIRTKVFEDFIRDNIDSWYKYALGRRLNVQRMEDIIFVSGCTLVTSWAAGTFPDKTTEVEISLETHALSNGGAEIRWVPNLINPSIVRHTSSRVLVRFLGHVNPTPTDPSFIRRGYSL